MNEPATVGEMMALVGDTQALLRRAGAALERCPLMGPKMLGELISPIGHINDALRDHIDELEAVAARIPE